MTKQKKAAALKALCTSSTLTEAAEKAGISRRTLYTYIREDGEFAAMYNQIQEITATAAAEDAGIRAEKAARLLENMMDDEAQPAFIRLKAAKILLEISAKQQKISAEIAQRITTETNDPFRFLM